MGPLPRTSGNGGIAAAMETSNLRKLSCNAIAKPAKDSTRKLQYHAGGCWSRAEYRMVSEWQSIPCLQPAGYICQCRNGRWSPLPRTSGNGGIAAAMETSNLRKLSSNAIAKPAKDSTRKLQYHGAACWSRAEYRMVGEWQSIPCLQPAGYMCQCRNGRWSPLPRTSSNGGIAAMKTSNLRKLSDSKPHERNRKLGVCSKFCFWGNWKEGLCSMAGCPRPTGPPPSDVRCESERDCRGVKFQLGHIETCYSSGFCGPLLG